MKWIVKIKKTASTFDMVCSLNKAFDSYASCRSVAGVPEKIGSCSW